MKLTEFARIHNISDRHARRLFLENQADIDGHYERRGKAGTDIDDFAAEYLASKLLKPNAPGLPGSTREQEYVGKYVDLSIKYTELVEAYKQQAEKLSETQQQLSDNAGAVALLEAAKEDKAALQGRVEKAEARAEQADQERRESEERARVRERELEAKANNLQKQLENQIQQNRDLQNAPLWKRIFNWK